MKKLSRVNVSVKGKEKQTFRVPQEMTVNTLHSLYLKFCDFPLDFREMVCEGCQYSTPTFYRKMRPPGLLSKAEHDMIISVATQQIEALKAFIETFLSRSVS